MSADTACYWRLPSLVEMVTSEAYWDKCESARCVGLVNCARFVCCAKHAVVLRVAHGAAPGSATVEHDTDEFPFCSWCRADFDGEDKSYARLPPGHAHAHANAPQPHEEEGMHRGTHASRVDPRPSMEYRAQQLALQQSGRTQGGAYGSGWA